MAEMTRKRAAERERERQRERGREAERQRGREAERQRGREEQFRHRGKNRRERAVRIWPTDTGVGKLVSTPSTAGRQSVTFT